MRGRFSIRVLENRLQNSSSESEPKSVQDTPAPPNPPGLVNTINLSKKESSFTILGLYPNPFEDYQILHYGLSKNSNIQMSLLNESGQVLMDLLNKNQPEGVYSFDLKNVDLASGNYFWKIQSDEFVRLIKVVKF